MAQDIASLLKETKESFEKTIEFLKRELSSLRTSRPSSELVEDIMVESYGQKMPLKHIASITIAPPSTIVIQPWDKNNMEPICSAIIKSTLGMQPIADKDVVRLNLPPLSEERRKEIIKVAKHKCEEAKIAIRKAREDALHDLKKMEEEDAIREDEKFSLKDKVQKLVDEYNEKINGIMGAKEREILDS